MDAGLFTNSEGMQEDGGSLRSDNFINLYCYLKCDVLLLSFSLTAFETDVNLYTVYTLLFFSILFTFSIYSFCCDTELRYASLCLISNQTSEVCLHKILLKKYRLT